MIQSSVSTSRSSLKNDPPNQVPSSPRTYKSGVKKNLQDAGFYDRFDGDGGEHIALFGKFIQRWTPNSDRQSGIVREISSIVRYVQKLASLCTNKIDESVFLNPHPWDTFFTSNVLNEMTSETKRRYYNSLSLFLKFTHSKYVSRDFRDAILILQEKLNTQMKILSYNIT